MESPRRILIINGKGGCGKTTIATNLAVAYANRGHCVALMDHDTQASATEWAEQRPAKLVPVHLIRAHQRAAMYQTQSFHLRIPPDATRLLIDAASISADRDIDQMVRQSDIVVVPMLPSSIDIRAGSKFIAELLTHKSFRKHPLPVCVVANRVKRNSPAHEKLVNFLDCLDVPTVASFADSAFYNETAEHGTGIHELTRTPELELELAEWDKLVTWLDSQPVSGALRQAAPLRAAIKSRVAAKNAG